MMKRLFLVGCLFLLTVTTSNPPPASKSGQIHTIYVVRHNWHAGLVLPRAVMTDELKNLPLYYSDSEYFEIGWGDSGFYQHPDITVPLTLEALFWPSDSVMHVVSLAVNPVEYFTDSEIVALSLSESQFKPMIAFIANSFATDENQLWRRIGPGLYGQSRFFHGNGIYHGLYTCNSWTAEALRVAGVPMNQWLSLTSGSVMLQVKQANLSRLATK